MQIKYGAQVKDREGRMLGSVDHLARDPWSGSITRFVVLRRGWPSDLFLKPEDVEEATDAEVRLKMTASELEGR